MRRWDLADMAHFLCAAHVAESPIPGWLAVYGWYWKSMRHNIRYGRKEVSNGTAWLLAMRRDGGVRTD